MQRGTRLQVGFVRDLYYSGVFRRGEDVLGRTKDATDGFDIQPVVVLGRVASTAGEDTAGIQ